MIKIGLVGSQSTHAAEFARRCNLPDENGKFLFPDVRVTAVYGVDDTQEHLERTMAKGNIPVSCDSFEALFDHCNAFMILQRRGGEHLKYAAEVIRRGLPVFIDKPVCATVEEARLLGELAGTHDCVICGGSGFVHNSQVKDFKAEMVHLGTHRGGSIRYCADISCPYDGIAFYLPHAVELMLELFGDAPGSVRAQVRSHDDFTLWVSYGDFEVELILDGADTPILTVNADETLQRHLDSREDYTQTLIHFVTAIKTGAVCHDTGRLTRHVLVILAAKRSMETGKTVAVESV